MIADELLEEVSKKIGLKTKGGLPVIVLEIKNNLITGTISNKVFGSLVSWNLKGKETSGKKWLDLDLNPDKQ